MHEIAKEHKEYLATIKKCIKQSHEFWSDNNKRYNDWLQYIFVTTITSSEQTVLAALQKPQLEFNKLEPYLSRLRGEFAKAQPDVLVKPAEGYDTSTSFVDLLQSHLDYILYQAQKSGVQSKAFTEACSGGFSVLKVYTEYENAYSMNQIVKVTNAFYPTLCFFDPDSTRVDKSDGAYCAEAFPMRKDAFMRAYPDVDISQVTFTRSMIEGNFDWSFKNASEEIIMLVDFYVKKKKRFKLYSLAGMQKAVTKEEYEKMQEEASISGQMAQIPAIVKERWSEKTTICRYRCIDNQVIEYKETIFDHLPLIFFDWNSVRLQSPTSGNYQQITRGVLYNAKGAQQLTNLSGQSLANEIENTIQAKYVVAKESIPSEMDYLKAYQQVQSGMPLVYNYFYQNDPQVTLPRPDAIPRTPCPPEIISTFANSDALFQSTLGSYDSAEGSSSQMSGVAIRAGAIQSNATASVGIQHFLTSLNQVAVVILSILPKIYVGKRQISGRIPSGQVQSYEINTTEDNSFNYRPEDFTVTVQAGANFAIQKADTLTQITQMMQASPTFSEFMNSQGLDILVQNMDIMQQSELQERAQQFMQQQQQNQQMAQQQPQQDPQMIRAQAEISKSQMQMQIEQAKLQGTQQIEQAKIMSQQDKDRIDVQIKLAELAIDKQKADTAQVEAMAKMRSADLDAAIQMDKASAEKARTAADLALKTENIEEPKNLKDTYVEMRKAEHEVQADINSNKNSATTEK